MALSIMTLSIMTFSIMTLSIMTLSIMTLSITILRTAGKRGTVVIVLSCHDLARMMSVNRQSVVMLSVVAPFCWHWHQFYFFSIKNCVVPIQ